VGSAGVWAADGQPASAYAIEEMARRGIALNVHRSRNVTREIMAQADLVLVMTHHHAEAQFVGEAFRSPGFSRFWPEIAAFSPGGGLDTVVKERILALR